MSAPKLTAEELDEVGASFSAGCSEAAELKNEYMARICLHSLRLHAEHAALNAEVAALRNCGQDGVCATPPGCLRHWEERNRELAAELRGQITEGPPLLQPMKQGGNGTTAFVKGTP